VPLIVCMALIFGWGREQLGARPPVSKGQQGVPVPLYQSMGLQLGRQMRCPEMAVCRFHTGSDWSKPGARGRVQRRCTAPNSTQLQVLQRF
jgi:hypothetical protein